MVVTDLPFSRPNTLQSRYALLQTQGTGTQEPTAEQEEEPAQTQEPDKKQYAAFLK